MNYKKGIMPVVVFLLVTAFAGLGMLVYSNHFKLLLLKL
jgi:hypothetical protein